MEETVLQIYVLIVCLFSGILGGVLYEPFYFIRRVARNRIVGIVADILFFILFAAVFVLLSVIYDFPDVRPYMIVGAFGGLLLYLISAHRIVAFLFEKLYNIAKKTFLRFRRALSGKTNERRKVQKVGNSRHGHRRYVTVHSDRILDLSDDIYFGKKP